MHLLKRRPSACLAVLQRLAIGELRPKVQMGLRSAANDPPEMAGPCEIEATRSRQGRLGCNLTYNAARCALPAKPPGALCKPSNCRF